MIDKSPVRRVDAANLRCFCHVERISNACLVKFVYESEVDGARFRGRHRIVWLNIVEKVCGEGKVRIINV